MNPLKNNKLALGLGLTPVLRCGAVLLRFLRSGQPFSAKLILEYTPENPALAAILVNLTGMLICVIRPFILRSGGLRRHRAGICSTLCRRPNG